MKLTTHLVSAPLHTPFVTALRTATHADSLLVEISDGDAERLGRGAAGLEGDRRVARRRPGLRRRSRSRPRSTVWSPTTSPRRCGESRAPPQGNFGAKAAVDVALHDLAARRRGQTLHGFLGSTVDDGPHGRDAVRR